MPSGNFKTESSGPVGSLKVTEFKLAKKWIEVSSDTRWERRKRETSQRALLVGGEKCCKPTDAFLKSSAASASTSANTVSTSTPGRKTGQWGIWARGGWRGRHGWLRDGKTRLYYGAAGSDNLLMCFMYWGEVVYSLGIYVYYHRGYQKCLFFMCIKNCACAHPLPWAAGGCKCQGRFLFPVHHCCQQMSLWTIFY